MNENEENLQFADYSFYKKIRLFLFFLLFLIINLYKNTNMCIAIIYSI